MRNGADAIVHSALAREVSRTPHARPDFYEGFLAHTLAYRQQGAEAGVSASANNPDGSRKRGPTDRCPRVLERSVGLQRAARCGCCCGRPGRFFNHYRMWSLFDGKEGSGKHSPIEGA